MKPLLKSLYENLSFIPSNIEANEDLLLSVGYPNETLKEYADYEWLWRVALLNEFDFISEEKLFLQADFSTPSFSTVTKEELSARAYLIGTYAPVLQYLNIFDSIIVKTCEIAESIQEKDFFTKQLETVLTKDPSKTFLSTATGPMIVWKGSLICGDVLPVFSKSLSDAFKANNQPSLHLDFEETIGLPIEDAKQIAKIRLLDAISPKAIIGMQTTLFSETLPNHTLLGNCFHAPKLQFIFDHPMNTCYYLLESISDFYVFSLDDDYTNFINENIKTVKKAFTLPPAGIASGIESKETYSVSFVGKYFDYKEKLRELDELPTDKKALGYDLFEYMKENPSLPVEKAFETVAPKHGLYKDQISPAKWVVALHQVRAADNAAMFYYREQIIKTILDAGIELHVFSDAWHDSPFKDCKNLIIHPFVDFKTGLSIMSQSKISLNIMSWHKKGMTERIANAMLNHSVCLTDHSAYLDQHFKDRENIVFYDLEHLDTLPGIIQDILSDDSLRKTITDHAYSLATNEHTWSERANSILSLQL